ncbi:hypothetical protein JRO89_XS13G0101800 [Xanthoceras sorbifolium]|uniref:ABC transporter domain-containing protein n=1 Tax=Xanthoceras sorbifolium TaxID=99658 RepID=A0ABQ8H7K3_9ROSI|nr:hypothetical protein JRO89_XS13G0101800 [Xanthoceras sorbifolium]
MKGILTGLRIFKPKRHSLTILNDISGAIKLGRMTLLLGPPGAEKSTLLLALAGKLDSNLEKSGNITYNGHKLDEFHVQRTSAYISQTDNHIAELTVRETLDFAARFQGSSEGFAGYMKDLTRFEKEKNIRPSPEIDTFMKVAIYILASSVGGKKHSISTDYVLKVLGLDVCSETIVGSDILKGVSGGQRKKVTTALSSLPRSLLIAQKIVNAFIRRLCGIYQGPRADVLEFFESLGFKRPPRKGVADFIQELDSRVPYSILEAVVWSCVVYYTVGFAPSPGRFFRFMFLLFSLHQMALGLFRMMASLARDMIIANTFRSAALLIIFLLGGFIIPKEVCNVLQAHSLPSGNYWYWIGIVVLLLYSFLFNGLVTLALAYLNPFRTSQTMIPLVATEENYAGEGKSSIKSSQEGGKKKGMILPFQPLAMTFHNVNYFVDMPKAMTSKGIPEKKLQLLSSVSGVFSPSVRTALVGSSGAGKTTLMDVFAGRKTGGSSDLSTEQSKRLTIAVELVANPSIIFIDEPTSGLDAQAAAIVMRAVRNTVDTGRTVVCTIHQPSIDIFEAFDELLLMKRGGRVINGGKLGVQSQIMVDYFQAISGITPIPSGYNPATWMLEVTTPAIEQRLSVDFADLYRKSDQYR